MAQQTQLTESQIEKIKTDIIYNVGIYKTLDDVEMVMSIVTKFQNTMLTMWTLNLLVYDSYKNIGNIISEEYSSFLERAYKKND